MLEQFGALTRGESAFVPQHQTEVRDGLPMGACADCVARGGRAVPDDGVLVTGKRGVVDDARYIRSVMFDQCGEDALIQSHEPRRRQSVGDGAPGELVPEGDPARRHRQQTALLGSRQRRHARRTGDGNERVNQPALNGGRHDSKLLEDVLNRSVQAPDPG